MIFNLPSFYDTNCLPFVQLPLKSGSPHFRLYCAQEFCGFAHDNLPLLELQIQFQGLTGITDSSTEVP